MSDLTDRLRRFANATATESNIRQLYLDASFTALEAADRIEELEAEVARLNHLLNEDEGLQMLRRVLSRL